MRGFVFLAVGTVVVQAQLVLRSFPFSGPAPAVAPVPLVARSHHLLPRQGVCSSDQVVCSFGGCCPGNTTCVIVSDQEGCCPVGSNCGQSSSVSSEPPATSTSSHEATTSSSAAKATTTSTTSSDQGACQSGYLACTDGTGGCCPSGSQCITTNGTPGCSAECSSSDPVCGTGCCTGDTICDSSSGFCVSPSNNSSSAPPAAATQSSTVTGHVSMSILGGGTLNYQTSSSTSTSIAVARSVPDMTLWVQCLGLAFVIVMGMLVVL